MFKLKLIKGLGRRRPMFSKSKSTKAPVRHLSLNVKAINGKAL